MPKCSTCGKPIGSSDRRRRYCSDACRANGGKPKLRALAEGERPDAPADEESRDAEMTVFEAARNGSDLEFLVSLRDRIARTVSEDTCPPRELASLSRRLEEIRRQINVEKQRLLEEDADAQHVDDEEWDEEAI